MSAKLPRASREVVAIEGDVWNALVTEVERLGRWSVAAPLELKDDGAGFGLAVLPPAPSGFWIRVQGGMGAFGVYYGQQLVFGTLGGAPIDPATVSVSAVGSPTGATLVVINKHEPLDGSGHYLTESPANLDHPAQWTNILTNETPARHVVVISGHNFYDCPEEE